MTSYAIFVPSADVAICAFGAGGAAGVAFAAAGVPLGGFCVLAAGFCVVGAGFCVAGLGASAVAVGGFSGGDPFAVDEPLAQPATADERTR